jgi:cytidylate kinase
LLVTISGLPGTGTTTASRLVAEALGLERVPGGEVFRQMAAEAGMSLADFGVYAIDHPEIDRELDRRLEERARAGGCVIESRLAGWLAHQAALRSVRVWLRCDDDERARRVASRDGTTQAQALLENRERAAVEHGRYLAFYGIDLEDLTIYDLVLDSTIDRAPVLAREIIATARATFA